MMGTEPYATEDHRCVPRAILLAPSFAYSKTPASDNRSLRHDNHRRAKATFTGLT